MLRQFSENDRPQSRWHDVFGSLETMKIDDGSQKIYIFRPSPRGSLATAPTGVALFQRLQWKNSANLVMCLIRISYYYRNEVP